MGLSALVSLQVGSIPILSLSSSFSSFVFLNNLKLPVPGWLNNPNFIDCNADMTPFVEGLCDAVVLTLSTGYAVGCLVALILNGILPHDPADDVEIDGEEEHHLEVKKLVEDPDPSHKTMTAGGEIEASTVSA